MRRILVLFVGLGVSLCSLIGRSPSDREPQVHTFSIVAFDPVTKDLGVAVESKYFGVGSVVPWAQAGVGVVATQARARMSFGPEGLKLMASGLSPRDALEHLLSTDSNREQRQVALIDAQGRPAAYTGHECFAWAGQRIGLNYSVQGNLLAGEDVVTAMATAYEMAQKATGSELADWLLAALQAGQAAGGDKRGQQSAALLVVRANGGPGGDNDRYLDLRVEDHPKPIEELARLRALHREFYRTR